jgi:DNA primase
MTPFTRLIDQARAVRIEDEIQRRSIKLRGKGADRCGACPQCGGDDRFAINTAKQCFNCRGCGAKGDVIDLVRHIDGCDVRTAVFMLTGVPTPIGKGNGLAKAIAIAKKKARLRRRRIRHRTTSYLCP